MSTASASTGPGEGLRLDTVSPATAVPAHIHAALHKPPSSPVVTSKSNNPHPGVTDASFNNGDDLNRKLIRPSELGGGNNSPFMSNGRRRPSSRRPAHKRDISEFSLTDNFPNNVEDIASQSEVKAENLSPDASLMKRNRFIRSDGDEEVSRLTEKFASRRHSITASTSGLAPANGTGEAQHSNHPQGTATSVLVAASSSTATNPPPTGLGSPFLNNNSTASTQADTMAGQLPLPPASSATESQSPWSTAEDTLLGQAVQNCGQNWEKVAEHIPRRSATQCMQRWSKTVRPGLRKGTWTEEEDRRLIELVQQLPKKNWGDVAALITGRSAKQCRERWCYNLDPSINKNVWTAEEDAILINAQAERGNRWAHIASLLPGRTENAVKTRFKSIMRAKKREWSPEEDDIILKMHTQVGSRWDTIAEKLPNRTKNAVKTRYRLLSKGLASKPPPRGAPNQTLRMVADMNANMKNGRVRTQAGKGLLNGLAPGADAQAHMQSHMGMSSNNGGAGMASFGGGTGFGGAGLFTNTAAAASHQQQQQIARLQMQNQALGRHTAGPNVSTAGSLGRRASAMEMMGGAGGPGYDGYLHDMLDPFNNTALPDNPHNNESDHGQQQPPQSHQPGMQAAASNNSMPTPFFPYSMSQQPTPYGYATGAGGIKTVGTGAPPPARASQNRRRSSITSALNNIPMDDIIGDVVRRNSVFGNMPDAQRRLSTLSQFSQGDFRRGSGMFTNTEGMADESLISNENQGNGMDEDLIDFLDAWNQGPFENH